jgi:hypothetical protein
MGRRTVSFSHFTVPGVASVALPVSIRQTVFAACFCSGHNAADAPSRFPSATAGIPFASQFAEFDKSLGCGVDRDGMQQYRIPRIFKLRAS